jgi:hypothetical protein
MRVVFYPVGDANRASSRYRVHNIVKARDEFVIGTKENWKKADALVFQRTFGGRYYDIAKKAKKAGKLVISDISDFYFYRHKWKAAGVRQMAELAHCLTTSNEDDAAMMRKVFRGKKVSVIPNAQRMSKHRRKHRHVPVPTVVWLGRENTMEKTLGGIWPVFQRLALIGVRFRILLINDTGSRRGLPPILFTEVLGRKWKLDEVHKRVAGCDVGVCPQVKQPNGRYHKDWNKAVTCWTCGVPCVVFNITKDWFGDLRTCLTDWRYRERQGKRGIERAKKWSPGSVAGVWKEVIDKERGRLK